VTNEIKSTLKKMKDGERMNYGEYLIKYDEDSWFGNQYRVYINGKFIDNSIHAEDIVKIINKE